MSVTDMDHKKDVKQTDSESSSLGTRNEKPASTDMASKEEGHYVETILPEGTNLNELGVPVIGGATGNKLLMWITFTASMGFGLFGVSRHLTTFRFFFSKSTRSYY
jgi:hypothetical protein